jgi:hypothetical protein
MRVNYKYKPQPKLQVVDQQNFRVPYILVQKE